MPVKKRKKRRGLSLTGILLGLVIVLAVILCIVVWLFFKTTREQEFGQSQGRTEVLETGPGEDRSETGKTGPGEDRSETGETGPGEDRSETGETGPGEDRSETEETGPEEDRPEAPDTERKQDQEGESETADQSETETERGTVKTSPEHETEEPESEKLVVAIDPGHQGSWVDMSDTEPNGPGSSEMKAKASVGTEGRFSGKKEYELNLEISLLLRDELEARGYEVILTREDHDTAISNAERALLAYEQGGDIYVRIHANGSDDSSVSGALAMVPSSANPYVGDLAADSYLLGQCILDAYCERASFRSLGVQYYDNMTGMNWSRLPVMILEMGFMTNEADDLRMADTAVQPEMAKGIADGIDTYFEKKGLKKKVVSAQEQSKVDTALEMLGEEFIYPYSDRGEQWAVSLKALYSGAEGNLNGDVQMKSASVIKVFLMAAIYDRICYPSSEDRRITFPESYEGELKQLITDMITVSDNNAANTLLRGLGGGDASEGMRIVNEFCEENGYSATRMGRLFLEENPSGDNYTSANDCLRLLESIYSGTCVSAEASAKMLAYLEQQTRRNKIPAGITSDTAKIFNKTGELGGEYGDYVENDIAVAEKDGLAYVVCILSGNLSDNGEAVTRITGMSELVYRQLLSSDQDSF